MNVDFPTEIILIRSNSSLATGLSRLFAVDHRLPPELQQRLKLLERRAPRLPERA